MQRFSRPATRKMSSTLRGKLKGSVNKGRRETLYRMLAKQNNGTVPCFVCGRHVKERNATLEHIVPRSRGGTDGMSNLSISHYQCNQRRGNDEEMECAGLTTNP